MEITDDVQFIQLPQGFKFIHFEMHGKNPCFWAIVDKRKKLCEYQFVITGTGQDIPESAVWLGTCLDQRSSSTLVWHLHHLI